MAGQHALDLERCVTTALTPATTKTLPPQWHGDFNLARARQWIEGRDAESATLLEIDRQTGEPIGLVEWARGQAGITSISGGVDEHNPASSRVLVKNGFRPVSHSSGGEQIYELRLPSPTTR